MISPEGEVVDFTESAFARGPVEHWLNNIQQTMYTSLYLISKHALETYPKNGAVRDDWLFETAAQTILVIDQIQWTCGVEEAIYEIMGGKNRGALVDFEKFSNDQL
jgi:dynein heavy chain